MSDIESIFHQVQVRPEDCSALRFLWWPNGNLDEDPEELMVTVHLFGGVSSPSCANFALRKTANNHRQEVDPENVSTVERNFYVDDCLKSVKTPHFAIRLVQALTELLKKGGFRLTKWVSNSREVEESIPEKERTTSVKNLDFEHQWHVSSDTFGFNFTIKDKPATRSGILSIISSVYDPLGFVAPFILPAKIILQDLCKKKFGWDDKIPEEHSTSVLRYIKNDGRRYQTFVANRVSAIREQSSPCQWKYVDTKLNPADDASRGMTAEAITEANRWINGPDFLWQDKGTWPKFPAMTPEEPREPCEPSETKATFFTLTQPVDQLVDEILKRFSSWLQLKRCIAWMLRFNNQLRNAVAKRRSVQKLSFA
ncbi:uncharacterized protein [Montipora capricornis]|uniref:uncharacterized protein n=1 Tax=Montipora capricornis TaxID=246305 RepID=UPI0035F16278